jgi:hypothetical protein
MYLLDYRVSHPRITPFIIAVKRTQVLIHSSCLVSLFMSNLCNRVVNNSVYVTTNDWLTVNNQYEKDMDRSGLA